MAALHPPMDGPHPQTVQWIIAIYRELSKSEQIFRATVESKSNDITHLEQQVRSMMHRFKDETSHCDMQQQLIGTQNQLITSLRAELDMQKDTAPGMKGVDQPLVIQPYDSEPSFSGHAFPPGLSGIHSPKGRASRRTSKSAHDANIDNERGLCLEPVAQWCSQN